MIREILVIDGPNVGEVHENHVEHGRYIALLHPDVQRCIPAYSSEGSLDEFVKTTNYTICLIKHSAAPERDWWVAISGAVRDPSLAAMEYTMANAFALGRRIRL